MNSKNIFITGGTGTLGKAILKDAQALTLDHCFTIYSRDEIKQVAMKAKYPHARFVIGDVADYDTLQKAMAGHDTVIHAAAFKHVPSGEKNVMAMMRSNVEGSRNVARAASALLVKQVVGISTDKACEPINAYGASKLFMEKIFQEYNRDTETDFHLVRYGNVIGSTGSVIPAWKEMYERDGFVTATDPDMTRFWLTEEKAVELVWNALSSEAGTILIPMLPACTMADFGKWAFEIAYGKQVEFRYTGLRAGEKMHETLLTEDETRFTQVMPKAFILHPVTQKPVEKIHQKNSYKSNSTMALRMSVDMLRSMLGSR